LEPCVGKVMEMATNELQLELIIINDASSDHSLAIAHGLADKYSNIKVCNYEINQGKGAALSTGFKRATGDFVVVQDMQYADLEYGPMEIPGLLKPLIDDKADVVIRFAVLIRRHASCALFLAQPGQQVPDLVIQHVYRPEPHRYGNLLQGV